MASNVNIAWKNPSSTQPQASVSSSMIESTNNASSSQTTGAEATKPEIIFVMPSARQTALHSKKCVKNGKKPLIGGDLVMAYNDEDHDEFLAMLHGGLDVPAAVCGFDEMPEGELNIRLGTFEAGPHDYVGVMWEQPGDATAQPTHKSEASQVGF